MTHSIVKVKEFHIIFGHPVSPVLTPNTKDIRMLRVKLIAEELGELCAALGVNLKLYCDGKDSKSDMMVFSCKEDAEVDLVEAADALGDLDYVVQGANLVFGIPAEAVFKEIHESNMSKLGEDGKPLYREDGKIMKGPNYYPPSVKQVIERFYGASI